MTRLLDAVLTRWRLTAFLSSALMLAIAHGFERIGGLPPCYLCLKQREVYWVAMTVALVGMIVVRTGPGAGLKRLFNAALGLVFLVGVGVAAWHAGAEWGWWPGPSVCAGGGAVGSAADMAAELAATFGTGGGRIVPPSCDEAAWVFPDWSVSPGLSMAGWNVLISLALAAMSGLATRKAYGGASPFPPAPVAARSRRGWRRSCASTMPASWAPSTSIAASRRCWARSAGLNARPRSCRRWRATRRSTSPGSTPC